MKTGLPSVINNRYGINPQVKAVIYWSTGTTTYQDQILNVSDLAITSRVGQVGAVSGFQLTIDDTDGSIYSIYTTEDVSGVFVELYNVINGIDVLVATGHLTLTWLEGSRQVNISVESSIESELVEWPTVFGNTRYVPGRTEQEPQEATMNVRATVADLPTITVEGGSEFPQGVPMRLGIYATDPFNAFLDTRNTKLLYFDGSFAGDIFTVTQANAPYHTNIDLANRDTLDPDHLDPRIIWIDSDINLVGLFVDIPLYNANLCYRQEGNKCWFRNQFFQLSTGTPTLLPQPFEGFTINETVPTLPTRWGKVYIEGPNKALVDGWILQEGARVLDMETPETVYIVNQAPSTAVVEVVAWRKPLPDADPVLQRVPSSYFTIDLTGPTTVTFNQPLHLRDREGWEDSGIFASVRSTLSGNTATAIEALLTQVGFPTNATFAAVATDIDSIRSNFATREDIDGLQLATQMAWQARCALYVSQGDYGIKLLGKIPSSVYTYNDSNIELQSLVGSLTDNNDLVTRLVIDYSTNYTEDPKELIYENNINAYGLREDSANFFIYTFLPNIQYSLDFWGYRYSNTWTKATLAGFASSLILDPYDAVTLSTRYGVMGEVMDIAHNLETLSIRTSIILAKRPEDTETNNNFWTGGVAAPPATPDPTAGLELIDYIVDRWPVSNNSQPPAAVSYTLRVDSDTLSTRRGEDFEITVRLVTNQGTLANISATFDIEVISNDPSDVLSIATVAIVNGVWNGSVNVSGGSSAGFFTVFASSSNEAITYQASQQIEFDIIGEAVWVNFPNVVVRGQPFNVTIANGFPSVDYDLTLNITGADTLDPVIITTDAQGGGSATLTIDDGDDEYLNFTITLSRSTYSLESPDAVLLSMSSQEVITVDESQWVVKDYPLVNYDVGMLFASGTPASPVSAINGQGLGWLYSATRYVSFVKTTDGIALVEGTVGGSQDADIPFQYKYNATHDDRELDLDLKLLLQGAPPTAGQVIKAGSNLKPEWTNDSGMPVMTGPFTKVTANATVSRPAGTTHVVMILVGAGAGGGASRTMYNADVPGDGGGSGGTLYVMHKLDTATSLGIVIGAGGAGGFDGGDTTVSVDGTIYMATGGYTPYQTRGRWPGTGIVSPSSSTPYSAVMYFPIPGERGEKGSWHLDWSTNPPNAIAAQHFSGGRGGLPGVRQMGFTSGDEGQGGRGYDNFNLGTGPGNPGQSGAVYYRFI